MALHVVIWVWAAFAGLDQHIALTLLPGTIAYVAINMLFLWIFGETVEDQLGHLRFLLLFVGCGILGVVMSLLFQRVLVVDASSGGLAAVLGAYCMMFVRSRVLVLVPVPIKVVEVPALIFIVFWFVLQVVATIRLEIAVGATSLGVTVRPVIQLVMGAIGALLGLALRRPERRRVEWWSPQ